MCMIYMYLCRSFFIFSRFYIGFDAAPASLSMASKNIFCTQALEVSRYCVRSEEYLMSDITFGNHDLYCLFPSYISSTFLKSFLYNSPEMWLSNLPNIEIYLIILIKVILFVKKVSASPWIIFFLFYTAIRLTIDFVTYESQLPAVTSSKLHTPTLKSLGC